MKIQYIKAKNWSSGPKNCLTTTNTVTTSAVEDCADEDTIPVLQTIEKLKRVETVSACSEKCNQDSACEFYKWKNHKKEKKRECHLMEIQFVSSKKWWSAPRNC